MTDKEFVVSDELTTQPAPERWRDRFGDVWHEGDDGLMHSFETAPFPREHVERKWGPLVLLPGAVS